MSSFQRRPIHLVICCLVLLCFAVAKLGTVAARSLGYLPKLLAADVPSEHLMLWTGLGELAVVAAVMLGLLSVKRSCQIITLLGSGFLAYRLYAEPGRDRKSVV